MVIKKTKLFLSFFQKMGKNKPLVLPKNANGPKKTLKQKKKDAAAKLQQAAAPKTKPVPEKPNK